MIYTEIELAVLYLFKQHNATKNTSMAWVIFNTEIFKLLSHNKEQVEYAVRFAQNKGWLESNNGGRYIWPSEEAEQLIYWNSNSGGVKIMDIKEKRTARYKFLNELYNETGGSKNKLVNVIELGKNIGLDTNISHDVSQYLSDEGLLEFAALGGIIRITHEGIREIENALSHPDQETTYFPPVSYVNNIVNIHGNSSAPIQVGNTNSEQTTHIDNSNRDLILGWLQKLEEAMKQQEFDNQELENEIETVKSLLSTKKPKISFVTESMNVIKNILVGVTSNTVFQGLLATFPL